MRRWCWAGCRRSRTDSLSAAFRNLEREAGEDLTPRIRTAAGVSRSGPRIRARMGLGAQVGANQRLYRIDARNFLWRLDHEAVEVRHRDGDLPASLRDPARIPSGCPPACPPASRRPALFVEQLPQVDSHVQAAKRTPEGSF